MESLETINKRLLDYFGKNGNYQRYRVVWSDSQLEWRDGERNIFMAGILLRTERGPELLPKYPSIKAKHVFEIFYPTDNPELLNGKENYEPIYVFQDKNKNPLPVIWWVCEFLTKALTTPIDKGFDWGSEEDEKLKEYYAYFEELDDAVPEIPSRIKKGEGVALDNTEFWG